MKRILLFVLILISLAVASCEAASDSKDNGVTQEVASELAITGISFAGYENVTGISNIDNNAHRIDVAIGDSDVDTSSLQTLITHNGFSLLVDGNAYESRSTYDFSSTVIMTVLGEDGNGREWSVAVSVCSDPVTGETVDGDAASLDYHDSALESLIITEVGDAGTNLDYVEIRNFGPSSVKLTANLTFTYAYNLSLVDYQEFGAVDGAESNFVPIGPGVTIEPGEVFLIVEKDADITVDSDDADTHTLNSKFPELPATTRIFRCDRTNIFSSTTRLDDVQAGLSDDGGVTVWSQTPAPVEWSKAGLGTSTYSHLLEGFVPDSASTEDTIYWENTSTTGSACNPGVWPNSSPE